MTFREFFFGADKIKRDVEPLEGTRISLFNSVIPDWWSDTFGLSLRATPQLAERIWVAQRCIQLNAQQIASMPLDWHGPPSVIQPAWVSNPDPNMYPNGIADAMFAAVASIYGWGFAALYVTSTYADGFPAQWTVIDPASLTIEIGKQNGRRTYKIGETPLDPSRVVQIDRNPSSRAHGTSALQGYAQLAYGLLAAGNQAMTVNQGGVAKFYLKSTRRLTKAQSEEVQNEWMERVAVRNGAPPVVPPEIEPKELSLNPSDLALLDTQEFSARAIATAYGVPCVLLNMALQGGLTYQNPAALGEMWWRFELRPTATRIANALSAQMLPRGQFVTHRAEDTFAPLTAQSPEDDPQAAIDQGSQVASASPAQQRPLTVIGSGG